MESPSCQLSTCLNGSPERRTSSQSTIFVFNRFGEMVYHGRPADEEFERAVKKALREDGPADTGAGSGDEEDAVPLIASRSWTNADGREIRAAVKSVDETSVTFQMSNGKDVVYPLEKLSKESREAITAATTEE